MDLTKLKTWLQQPTTVAGVAAIAGTFVALVLHQMTVIQSASVLVGAIFAIAMPDNTAAKTDAGKLTTDILAGIGNNAGINVAAVASDAQRLANDIIPPPKPAA